MAFAMITAWIILNYSAVLIFFISSYLYLHAEVDLKGVLESCGICVSVAVSFIAGLFGFVGFFLVKSRMGMWSSALIALLSTFIVVGFLKVVPDRGIGEVGYQVSGIIMRLLSF